MERVQTLLNKLQEQIEQHALPEQMLLTVQMLQAELLHIKNASELNGFTLSPIINIIQPISPYPAYSKKKDEYEDLSPQEEESITTSEKINIETTTGLSFDPIEDMPTLIHQQSPEPAVKKEVHESLSVEKNTSMNEKLKQGEIELGDTLLEMPIKDLRKAIGVNDKFLFIKELFRGDEVMYERSIKTINSFSIYPEAEYWIKRELKLKLAWSDKDEYVQQFDQLIRRRFV